MDIIKALQERRSVRKYKTDPVPEEKIKSVLEAAQMAPSWKNKQCWSFIVVRDPGRKENLADSLPVSNPAREAIGQTAPVVIVLCADTRASGDKDGKDYYMLDAGLAMQQLMLAAYAEGLGTCWVGLFDEGKASEVCSVPSEYRVVAMTPLGVPEKVPAPRPRKEMTEFVYAEEWDQPISF